MSKHAEWVTRVALATVYIWFGVLKLLDFSPATQLVHDLFSVTVPSGFLGFAAFYKIFAVFEILIGVGILLPKYTRVAAGLVIAHVICTALPLVLLPDEVWTSTLVPTLEGQYIIKNVLIFAAAYALITIRRRKPI